MGKKHVLYYPDILVKGIQEGKTYKKGNRTRLVLKVDPQFVYYKTKTNIKQGMVSNINAKMFYDWWKDAELVEEW